MDRHKKKDLGFGNTEEKRNLRFLRKSIERSNVRHKRLSELRKLEDSVLEELPEEKTPVKPVNVEPKKMTYREKLKKWQEEKKLKKQLEARKRIPVFKVGRANPDCPPSAVTSKKKEPLKFIPKTGLKPPPTAKPEAKIASKIGSVVSAVFRPNLKENLRTNSTNNNSKQLTSGNPGVKPNLPSFRLPGKQLKTPSASNLTVSSVGSKFTSRVTKTSSSNNCVLKPVQKTQSFISITAADTPKEIPKTQSASGASVTGRIPNSRTAVPSRIVPPRSCNKQGGILVKPNVKPLQQKKVPAPEEGIKVNDKMETKSDEKKKEIIDADLVDSVCEEKSSREAKKRVKSFAPDDFVFTVPSNIGNFPYRFGNPGLLVMYSKTFGVPLPWSDSGSRSSMETESDGQKEDSEVPEIKSETAMSESCSLLTEGEEVADEESDISLLKPRDFTKVAPVVTPNVSTEDITQKARKEKISDMPLFRQLRPISENSPLPNTLELEADLGYDSKDDFFGGKTYQLRRSRRFASSFKTNPTGITGSDHLCPLVESLVDPPLTHEFSELRVDSPDIKQYCSTVVRRSVQENRISLLGSPQRPNVGPRKSIKGDLISFTP